MHTLIHGALAQGREITLIDLILRAPLPPCTKASCIYHAHCSTYMYTHYAKLFTLLFVNAGSIKHYKLW